MTSEIFLKVIDHTESFGIYEQVALIHKAEIKDGFLSTFTVSFLSRLYRSLANSPYSFLIVAIENNRVIGFICGGINTGKAMRRFILHHGLIVFPQVMFKMLSFRNMRKIFETLCYPAQKVNEMLPAPEILNFCVSGEAQGKGIGKKLFLALVDKFKALGIEEFKIVTSEEQKQAQKLYEKLSAVKVADIEIHNGTKSLVYIYKIAALTKLENQTLG